MALRNAGGLWLRDGKKGKFMSVYFEPEGKNGPKYSAMAFKNEDKVPGDKRPDYRIVMEDDPEGDGRRYEQTSRQRAVEDDSEVPF